MTGLMLNIDIEKARRDIVAMVNDPTSSSDAVKEKINLVAERWHDVLEYQSNTIKEYRKRDHEKDEFIKIQNDLLRDSYKKQEELKQDLNKLSKNADKEWEHWTRKLDRREDEIDELNADVRYFKRELREADKKIKMLEKKLGEMEVKEAKRILAEKRAESYTASS